MVRAGLINLKSNAVFSQFQNFEILSEMNLYKNDYSAKDKYLLYISNKRPPQMIQMYSLLIGTQGYPYIASDFFKNNPDPKNA